MENLIYVGFYRQMLYFHLDMKRVGTLWSPTDMRFVYCCEVAQHIDLATGISVDQHTRACRDSVRAAKSVPKVSFPFFHFFLKLALLLPCFRKNEMSGE